MVVCVCKVLMQDQCIFILNHLERFTEEENVESKTQKRLDYLNNPDNANKFSEQLNTNDTENAKSQKEDIK